MEEVTSMIYCATPGCGRKVMILLSRVRNPRSYYHGKHKSLKDHDLCRQCFKAMMTRARQAQLPPRGPS